MSFSQDLETALNKARLSLSLRRKRIKVNKSHPSIIKETLIHASALSHQTLEIHTSEARKTRKRRSK